MSNIYALRAHKKNRPEIDGPKITLQPNDSSAQSDIACNCQNQNPPLVKNKWKPGFVIKLFHRVSRKRYVQIFILLRCYYHNRKGQRKQEKTPALRCKHLNTKHLHTQKKVFFYCFSNPILTYNISFQPSHLYLPSPRRQDR